MIGKITAQRNLSYLNWLLAIVVTVVLFAAAPNAVLAQGVPSSIGYVVSGCDITTYNGTYNIASSLDANGNPYYVNLTTGTYLFAGEDDQDNRPYYRWYLGSEPIYFNGAVAELFDHEYMSGNSGQFWGAGDLVVLGPEYLRSENDLNVGTATPM